MDTLLQEVREKIEGAELVLVGLGEGFQYGWGALLQDERFQEIEREMGDSERYVWIVPFLQKMILRRGREERWDQAYLALKKLLTDKNYFVVSLCIDDYLYGAGLDEKRLVAPCGGKLRFNQIGVKRYAQEGYLGQWNVYTKWLQGTVNRKLCVLELGAGMNYPGIVRFPFEKTVYYNQKAFLYRVHPRLYQIGGEIADRSRGIAENPVDFLGILGNCASVKH